MNLINSALLILGVFRDQSAVKVWVVARFAVDNSHFSFGAAPQVGQRTASTFLRLGSFFMREIMPESRAHEWSIVKYLRNHTVGRGGVRFPLILSR
jgi:hypothetical protein